jgi:DNA replication initiation complex subunit (GINS family)
MYDKLFDIWRKTISRKEIQSLPKGFYLELKAYIRKIQKEKRMLDKNTIKGQLLMKEEENVKLMIESVIRTRYEKIMQLIMKGGNIPDALEKQEVRIYEETSSSTEFFQTIITNIFQGKKFRNENNDIKKNKKFTIIRIIQETSEIIGIDNKTYGPFEVEDIAMLPIENARILIKQGVAKKIETK